MNANFTARKTKARRKVQTAGQKQPSTTGQRDIDSLKAPAKTAC